MANTRRAADIMKQFQNMDTDDKNEDIEYIFGVDSEDNKQLEGLRSIQKSIAPELLHPHPNNQFNISYDSEYESLKKEWDDFLSAQLAALEQDPLVTQLIEIGELDEWYACVSVAPYVVHPLRVEE